MEFDIGSNDMPAVGWIDEHGLPPELLFNYIAGPGRSGPQTELKAPRPPDAAKRQSGVEMHEIRRQPRRQPTEVVPPSSRAGAAVAIRSACAQRRHALAHQHPDRAGEVDVGPGQRAVRQRQPPVAAQDRAGRSARSRRGRSPPPPSRR